MKHTKGPWKVDRKPFMHGYTTDVIALNGEKVVHDLRTGIGDANLIAAAPDLLEAAKAVYAAFCEADPESDASKALARAIEMAEGN